MVNEINADEFEQQVLKSKIPVVLDFSADWCMPCRMIAPILEELSKELKGKVKFLKIDTDKAREICSNYNITGIPCLIIFKNSKEAGRIVGVKPAETIKAEIESYI